MLLYSSSVSFSEIIAYFLLNAYSFYHDAFFLTVPSQYLLLLSLHLTVLRTGEILSLVACSGKSQYSSIWSTNLLSNDSYYYSDDAQQIVKQIRWLPPQTNNNNNSAAGCYFLLLNNDNIVCLSPCSAQGKCDTILHNLTLHEMSLHNTMPQFRLLCYS